ncbi:MAG TPA: hypothetical protein VH165_28515 [Kofleriaceae bacterium]|nr:hypothetical protein [Kofleriaceae bacterium]
MSALGPVWLACAACAAEPAAPLAPVLASQTLHIDRAVPSRPALDLLFVVDSSPAIAPRSAAVAARIAALVTALDRSPGGLPDLHAGVVTGDPADDGVLRALPDGARFVRSAPRLDGSRDQSIDGALGDALGALATSGGADAGATPQQPLAMAARALGQPANAGFVRDAAALAIVVISAGDDGSPGAVDGYAGALAEARPDATQLMIAAWAGGAANGPACAAVATPRLDQLLARFPDRSSATPLCDAGADATDTATPALIEQTDQVALGAPCVEVALADRDPARDGTQAECAVTLATPDDAVVIPACDAGRRAPCWAVTPYPSACMAAHHERFDVVHDGLALPSATRVIADCIAE